MSKNIIFNYNLESYKKKYRNNRYKLLSFSKKEIEDFNKKKKNKNVDFLLKNRKWALIGDTYYEIPKAPRWTWFRNLNGGIQFAACALLTGGIACAAVFPALYATIWKPITAGVDEKVKEYVEIETKEKLEVGKEAVIELSIKDSAKETKQLPSDPKALKVYTGGVLLDYWQKPITVTNTIYNSKYTSFADSVSSNDTEVEPDNYYSYYYTKDKADLYIKKILGPVVVDIVLEDRSYTVTFDPRNEIDSISSIEVKKDSIISQEQKRIIENTDYRKFKGWYLDDGTQFDFNTPITAPITLNAKYRQGTKTGFYIKGLKGIEQNGRYFEQDELEGDAYKKAKKIISELTTSIDEAKFKDTFEDYDVIEVDGKTRYLANLTWYVFGEVELRNLNNFYFSFGKNNKKIGENFDFYNTNIIGMTEDAKIDAWQRLACMEGNYKDKIDNPLNVKNIEFKVNWPEVGSDFILFYGGGGADSHFVLNIDNCKFDAPLRIYENHKTTIKIENSSFALDSECDYCFEMHRDDNESPQGKVKEDSLTFKNNVVDGSNSRKCIQLNDVYCKYGDIEGNTFKNVHTNSGISGSKPGDSVIQFSQGLEYNVSNNKFDSCKCNVFMIHADLPSFSSGVKLNINNNTLNKCSYVGVNETGDSTVYSLESSGNKIDATTKEDVCGLDTEITSESKYIFHIGH